MRFGACFFCDFDISDGLLCRRYAACLELHPSPLHATNVRHSAAVLNLRV